MDNKRLRRRLINQLTPKALAELAWASLPATDYTHEQWWSEYIAPVLPQTERPPAVELGTSAYGSMLVVGRGIALARMGLTSAGYTAARATAYSRHSARVARLLGRPVLWALSKVLLKQGASFSVKTVAAGAAAPTLGASLTVGSVGLYLDYLTARELLNLRENIADMILRSLGYD